MGASANIKSPEVSADHGVMFRIAHATDVTLNGSWDGAVNVKMTKDDRGVWSVTVASPYRCSPPLLVARKKRPCPY